MFVKLVQREKNYQVWVPCYVKNFVFWKNSNSSKTFQGTTSSTSF